MTMLGGSGAMLWTLVSVVADARGNGGIARGDGGPSGNLSGGGRRGGGGRKSAGSGGDGGGCTDTTWSSSSTGSQLSVGATKPSSVVASSSSAPQAGAASTTESSPSDGRLSCLSASLISVARPPPARCGVAREKSRTPRFHTPK